MPSLLSIAFLKCSLCPSVLKFDQLLSTIARNKHYSTTLSLLHRLDLLGAHPLVNPDIYTFNCFCRLSKVDFGFSLLGTIVKLSYEPDCVTFITLIRDLCADSKLLPAVELFHKIVENGFQPVPLLMVQSLTGYVKWAILVLFFHCSERQRN